MSKHEIRWRPADRLIEVKPMGFWTTVDFQAYEGKLSALIDRAGKGPFDLMVDMSEHIPQAPEIVSMHDELTDRLAARGLRYTVVIGASPLLGMQIKRATKALQPKFVSSAEEGRKWLRDVAGGTSNAGALPLPGSDERRS